jgi:CheY-like chemotaxis protein
MHREKNEDICYECMSINDKLVQVIFLTASEVDYEQLRRQSYPEFANDADINYVQKPIANQELIKLVNMLIAANHTK